MVRTSFVRPLVEDTYSRLLHTNSSSRNRTSHGLSFCSIVPQLFSCLFFNANSANNVQSRDGTRWARDGQRLGSIVVSFDGCGLYDRSISGEFRAWPRATIPVMATHMTYELFN